MLNNNERNKYITSRMQNIQTIRFENYFLIINLKNNLKINHF